MQMRKSGQIRTYRSRKDFTHSRIHESQLLGYQQYCHLPNSENDSKSYLDRMGIIEKQNLCENKVISQNNLLYKQNTWLKYILQHERDISQSVEQLFLSQCERIERIGDKKRYIEKQNEHLLKYVFDLRSQKCKLQKQVKRNMAEIRRAHQRICEIDSNKGKYSIIEEIYGTIKRIIEAIIFCNKKIQMVEGQMRYSEKLDEKKRSSNKSSLRMK